MKKYSLNNLIKFTIGVLTLMVLCAAVPSSGPFVTYKTQYQLNNPVQNAVSTVNTILCVLTLTKYSEHTNGGLQFVQVDQKLCDNSGNPGQQGNNSDNSAVPQIMNVAYNATRVGSQPESVDIWITANFDGGRSGSVSQLNAHLDAIANPTDSNPYGLFTFNFAGFPEGQVGVESAIQMAGYVKTTMLANGQVQLVYAETNSHEFNGERQTESSQVILIGNGTTTGYGRISMPNRNSSNTQDLLAMAYNSNNLSVLQNSGGEAQSFCYNRNSTTNLVYGYGIFDNNGNQVEISNGGYQVIYNGQHGWYGYYGIGLPSGIVPTDNTPITYAEQDGSNPLTGTVVVKGGRMNTVSAKEFTLADISGVPINVPQPYNGVSGGNASDIIQWDKSTSTFKLVGSQTCDNNGCITNKIVPPNSFGRDQFESIVQISFSGGQDGIGTVGLNFNGLGSSGNTQIKLFTGCTYNSQLGIPGAVTCANYIAPTNDTQISIWSNETVVPSTASPAIYYCVQNCPFKYGDNWTWGNPQYDGSGGESNGKNIPYISYSFDPESYTLTIVDSNAPGNGQVIAVGIGQVNNSFVTTGPLLTASQLDAIESDGYVNYALLYDGVTVNPYLQWQTSNQAWSSYTGIKDSSGNYIPLSNPLQMVYTDPNTGGANFLQYAGSGNLQGIPGACVDQSGNSVACGQGSIWVPAFNIPDKSELTTFGDDDTYWLRQLYVSQVLNKDTGSGCDSLSGDLTQGSNLTLPSISDGWDPSSIGPRPVQEQ